MHHAAHNAAARAEAPAQPHHIIERKQIMALPMDDRDGKIWFNGQLIEWRDAKTHVLTHTLHYGMGVFEGVRAYETAEGPAIFRLQEHTKRLFNSAKILGMKLPYTQDEINQAHIDVVKANNLHSCYFRPMAYYGAAKLGVAPQADDVQVILAAWPWGAYLGEEGMKRGIRVRVSSFTRHHPNIHMIKAKANGNYLNSILANTEATRDGYDEAILLDAQGYVAEGSGENIFVVNEGRLYTPALDVALDGITRKSVIAIAEEMGLPVIEKRITRDELYAADEVFFTGTAAEVTPIREIDNREIGIGERGPITTEIQQRYFDIVEGKNPAYRHWLTYVK
jgi:branched-chain amino acid aminotransferase